MPEQEVLGDHDSKIEESIAADAAALQDTIARHQASIEKHKRMAAEEMNHPRSKSAVEQARSIVYGVASTSAGLVGAPGMIADLAGWFAANGAQDAVELTEQLARLAYDVRDRTERARVENSLMPRPYGREDLRFSALLAKACR